MIKKYFFQFFLPMFLRTLLTMRGLFVFTSVPPANSKQINNIMTNNYKNHVRPLNGLRRWWLMLTGCILLALIGESPDVQAQNITNYAFTANGGTFTSIVGTPGAVNVTSIQADDASSALLPIGFTFYYMGVPYTNLWANSNGFLGLGSTISVGATYNPGLQTGAATSRPIIAPLWDDQNGSGGAVAGVATYVTTGLPGSRVFTFEWLNWRWTWNGPVAISYQAKLYEATGVVQFVYRPEGTPSNASASIGITAVGTGVGTFLSLDGTGISPLASSTTETSTLSTTPASGQTYTFTPPAAPATPSNLTFSGIGATGMTLNWTDVTGEIGYVVQRSLDGITFTNVASLPANTTSYAASSLFSGTNYFWNIIALSEGSISSALSGSQSTAAGTLCGTYTVGPTGNYATLTAAFNDIRANGLACPVILELQAAYTSSSETFPIWTGALGSGPSTSVTVRPEAGAVGLSIESASQRGVILDSLTSYVNFDGRPGGSGTTSQLTIQSNIQSSQFTANALRIVEESSNNSHQYVVFRGGNISTTSGVVFIGGSSVSSGFGNDNNSFDNCEFREGATFPMNTFYAAGQSASQMNDNCSITNSLVRNFFAQGTATAGINIQGSNNAWIISNNRIFQDATRTYSAGALHRGIVVNSTAGGNFSISGNIIGFGNATGTGTYTMTFASSSPFASRFFGIDINCAASPASTISNNQISNISLSTSSAGTGSSAVFAGIWFNAGNATISGNTIGSMSAADNILVRSTTGGGTATGPTIIGIGQGAATAGAITISNNNIGGLSFDGITATFAFSSANGGAICGIFNTGSTTLTDAGSVRNITGNTIGGTIAGSIRSGNIGQNPLAGSPTTPYNILGILNTGGTRINITNNTVQNFNVPTRSSAGATYGISSTNGLPAISGNTVRNIFSSSRNTGTTTAGTIIGINVSSTSTPVAGTSVQITNNQVYNLNSRADSVAITISGISYSGSATAGFSYLIQRNLVYDLQDITAPATAGDVALQTINGIAIQGGIPTVQNNMVRLGVGTNISHTYNGILKNVANSVAPIGIWHNSVYIGGTSTVNFATTPAVSAAFRRSLSPSGQTDDVRNNIFANVRTSAIANQFNHGIVLNANTLLNCDKNIYFVDTLNNGRTGFNGTIRATGLVAWRTASGADITSIFQDPNYVDPAAATPDLHLQAPPASVPAEQAGVLIAAVTDDFDGQVRSGLTPTDIGADAGDFIPFGDFINPTIASVSYSPVGAQCIAVNRTVTADVSDGSGLSSVVINWSLNGVAQTAIPMTNGGSGSIYTGTIPASGNAAVVFSVTAIDASLSLNSVSSAAQSYRDQFLFAGLSAGADQNICPGTSTNLTVSSPFLNSIVFSEVSGFETGTGAGALAPGITGFDFIELTNIGNQPVNISGWRLEVVGTTPGVYIIPAGNTVAAGGTFTIARTGGGAAIPGVYVNSTLTSVGSSTSQGFILSSTSGEIVDVVAINGGTPFNPVGAGNPAVTASMWSGTVPSSSGTAGIRRTASSDNNSASNWTVASATNLTNFGALNTSLGLINVATISWSTGATSSSITVSPSVSPSEYVVNISDGICSASDTVVVNLRTTLPAPTANNGTHCGAGSVTATINAVPGATAYRWYNDSLGGTAIQNSVSLGLAQITAVTDTFWVSSFDGTCESWPRIPVVETVTEPPSLTLTPTSPTLSACLNGTLNLSVASPNDPNYNYVWSGNGAANLNTTAGNAVVATWASRGVFTIIVTGTDNGSGCANKDTVVVTVNPLPTVSVDPIAPTVCLGESVSVTTTAYLSGGSTATTGYCASGATNTADTKIQAVTLGTLSNNTNPAACEIYTDYTTNNAIPVPLLVPGQTYSASVTHGTCGGFFGGYSKMWIDYNRNGAFEDPAELVLGGAHASTGSVVSGNVTIPLTALTGLTRMRVVLNEGGTATQSPCGTFTYGETEDYTVNIVSTGGLLYSWSPATGVSDAAIANPTITPAGNQLYTLEVTSSAGCKNTATVDIAVNSLPAPPSVTVNTVCGTQDSVAFVTPVPGATSYFWFDAPVAGNVLQASTSVHYLPFVSASDTIYVSSFNGTCYSNRVPVVIDVTPPPAIDVVSASGGPVFCVGSVPSTISLNDPIGAYTSYTWSSDAPGTIVSTSSNTAVVNPSAVGSYKYYLSGTDGACSNTDSITITVNPAPNITSFIVTDTTLCLGSVTTVTASAIPVNVLTGPQTPPTGYCVSGATNSADTKIDVVTLGTLSNSSPAVCETYTDNTGAVAAPILIAGQTYSASVKHGTCGGFFGGYSKMWIDFNRNGVFEDPAELVLGGSHTASGSVVSGNVTIPLTAFPGVTGMRVVLNESGTAAQSPCGTFTWGETEDYLVSIQAFNLTDVTYSWSVSGGSISPASGSSAPIYTGSALGAQTITLTVNDVPSGCSATQTKTVVVSDIVPTPTCSSPVTRCGPGNVTLSATGTNLFWTDSIGGKIIGTGASLVRNVTNSGFDYVRQEPTNATNVNIGYNPVTTPSTAAGYFPTPTQGMKFMVDNPGGTWLKSVKIIPNGPIGSPITINVTDNAGNVIGSASTFTTVTNTSNFPPFNVQTVTLDIFVPFSTDTFKIRPVTNPNLAVFQNDTVQSTSPWRAPGELRILGYGNMEPPYNQASPATGPSVFTSRTFGYFFDWEVRTGCYGSACAVQINVTAPPALTITPGSSTTICDNGSVSLTAAGTGYVNFSWSPATGLSSTNTAATTATVNQTTAYTVTADDGDPVLGCASTASITLNVNVSPFAEAGTQPDTLCTTSSSTFNGSGSPTSFKTIGTTTDPGQVSGWPFNGANLNQKMQLYVSKVELNAAGLFGPSFIQSLGFNVVNKLSTQPYTNFTVGIDTIPTGFGAFTTTTFYTIANTYYAGNYSTTGSGWNDIVFQTPFFWDGVHDLVIQTCFNNTTNSFFDQVYTSATPGINTTNAVNAGACGSTAGALLQARPNLRFQGGIVNYSWTPTALLSNPNIANPVFNAAGTATSGNYEYVLTVTDPSNNCFRTDTVRFVLDPTPDAPTAFRIINDSVFCNSGTASLRAVFTDGTLQWSSSTDGVNFTDIIGANNDTLIQVINTTTWFRVSATCGNASFSNILQYVVNSPQVLTSSGGSRCGQGNVTLNATATAGHFIQWFADSTSTSPLANSSSNISSYDAFVAQTDTFWVAAAVDTISAIQTVTGGAITIPSSGPGTPYPSTVSVGGLNIGSVVQSVSINGMSHTFPGDVDIVLVAPNGQAVTLLSDQGGGTDIVNVNLTFQDGAPVVPAIIVSGTYAPTNDLTGETYPAPGPTTAAGSLPLSTFTGNMNGNWSLFIVDDAGGDLGSISNWSITFQNSVCQSAVRIPVIATVTPAPAITLTPSTATLCAGGSVTLNVGGATASYTDFNWAPAAGLSSTTGTSVTAAPAATTTYTVTATGNVNGCQASATSVITVNPLPAFTLSSSSNSICGGGTATLTANVTSPLGGVYSVASIPHNPVTPPASPSAGPTGDDAQLAGVALPFPFTYNGVAQNTVNIYTNGFIQFGTSSNSTTSYGANIPTAAAPNNIVALAWEDLNVLAPGNIQYWTDGTAPNRKFVVAYNSVAFFASTGSNVTGQIVLNESDNSIEMFLTNVDQFGGNSAVCGIENATGTTGLVAPGRQFGPWGTTGIVNNEGWRFFLPPAPTIQWTGQNIVGSTTGATITANPTSSSYYVCTVTDPATGCTKADSILINASANPQPFLVRNGVALTATELCNPDTIMIRVADAGAFAGGYPAGTTFNWSAIGVPLPDLDSISSSNGSSYQVTVSVNGCVGTSNAVNVVTRAVTTIETVTNASCVSPGKINVQTASGLPPYRYLYTSDLAQTIVLRDTTSSSNLDSLTGLGAGTYYLQVFDNVGGSQSCNSGVKPIIVGGTSNPVVSFGTVTNVSCFGLNDGSIAVNWSGGLAPFSISWSNGTTSGSQPGVSSPYLISNLTEGTWTVTVTDASGCFGSNSVSVTQPAQVVVSLTSTPESPAGSANGTVKAVVSGGTAPYTYEWFDELLTPIVGSGDSLGGLAGGLYYCLVTDANLCQTVSAGLEDTIRVNVVNNATLNLTFLFEGMHDGAGGMVPALLNSGVAAGATDVDTVFVELRDALSPTTVIASGSGIVNTSGQLSLTLPSSVNGQSGYIAVFHRNAVQTWSELVTFGASTSYDFTTAATQAFGGNQIEVLPGVWAFYSGDIAPQDEFIDILDQGVIDNDIFNFASGYVVSDLSGDGFVDIVDQSIVDNNIFNFIGSIHP